MTCFRSVSITILTIAVATACVDQNSTPKQVEADRDAAAATATAASSTGSLHELFADPTGGEAFPLVTGSFITGSLVVPTGSNVSAFAIQIGNYANSSVGDVSVELCDGDQCSGGKKSLVGSTDNQYLEIPLDQPLEVRSENGLTYRFTKVDGTGPVALWTYQPTETITSVKVNDGADLERAPNIALRY